MTVGGSTVCGRKYVVLRLKSNEMKSVRLAGGCMCRRVYTVIQSPRAKTRDGRAGGARADRSPIRFILLVLALALRSGGKRTPERIRERREVLQVHKLMDGRREGTQPPSTSGGWMSLTLY